MSEQWYSRSFRRNLVDMHIDDWNPVFLTPSGIGTIGGFLILPGFRSFIPACLCGYGRLCHTGSH